MCQALGQALISPGYRRWYSHPFITEEGTQALKTWLCVGEEGGADNLRCVDYQAVPLPLDVIFRWLFGDIQAIKFQFPGNFLFSFEYHQRDLGGRTLFLSEGFLIKALSPKHFNKLSFHLQGNNLFLVGFLGCLIMCPELNLLSLLGLVQFPFQKLILLGPPFKVWVKQLILMQTGCLSHPSEKVICR